MILCWMLEVLAERYDAFFPIPSNVHIFYIKLKIDSNEKRFFIDARDTQIAAFFMCGHLLPTKNFVCLLTDFMHSDSSHSHFFRIFISFY